MTTGSLTISRHQRLRILRQKILVLVLLPAGYLMYRYVALDGRFGWFMCSEDLTMLAAQIILAPMALLCITFVIELPMAARRAWWVTREEMEQIMPTPRPLRRYLLYGAVGIVLLELVSVIGCWLRS